MTNKTFHIKGRYVILLWLVPLIYLPGTDFIYEIVDPAAEWFWFDIAFYYYYHAITVAFLAALVAYFKINWRLVLTPIDPKEYPGAVKLTAFTMVFSVAAAYALFLPLSYIWPDFVRYWYIDLPPFIYSSEGVYPALPNLLSFLSLVVFAPLIEEFTFRGILLHRWTLKFGMNRAIVYSSLLFAIVHPDPIGAFAFGVAMSALYLRSQTLWLPILCHALNNFIVWLIEAGFFYVQGPDYAYTLEDFQSEWYLGMACALLSIIWIYAFLKRKSSHREWRLPNL